MQLVREDWDFSELPTKELRAALAWEILRECPDVHEIAAKARLWLTGQLSIRKPRLSPAQRRILKGRNLNFSDAEKAAFQVSVVFSDFISTRDFHLLHKWGLAKRRLEFNRWRAKQLRPVLLNWSQPWLRLPRSQREQGVSILEKSRLENVVHVGSWWDAIGHFKRSRIDPGLPLKFHYSDYTTILLTINWRLSTKRILSAIGRILETCAPPKVSRWNARGRKNRDMLVALERIGMMRLLHHFTLAEIRLKLPDAWHLYENRKWYEERRHALAAIRARSRYTEPNTFFPLSWQTKAQQRKASQLSPK